MAGELQNWVALAIVLLATAYLARRSWRSIAKKRAGGCGACGSCPGASAQLDSANAGKAPLEKPLVRLDTHFKPRL